MKNFKTRYALRNGQIVDINDLDISERGEKCGCVCPACKSILQARLGTGKRVRYFAHSNSDCSADIAYETTLHYMAKEIYEKELRITLPRLDVHDESINEIDLYMYGNPYDLYERLVEPIEVLKKQLYKFDYVVLEKRIDEIIPDVILIKGTHRLLVEIAVTHFIDDEKLTKIKALNLSTIEVDLSGFKDEPISYEDLKRYLLHDTSLMRWIHNIRSEKAEIIIKERNQKILDAAYDEMIEREKAKEKERLRLERLEKKNKELYKKIQLALEPEKYRKRIYKLRDDREAFHFVAKQSFYIDHSVLPFFVDIPIQGEIAFYCDRRVWQSIIFDKFIYDNKSDTVSISKIMNWLFSDNKDILIDRLYSKSVVVKGHKLSLVSDAIKQYIKYLSELGFVEKTGRIKHSIDYLKKSKCNIPPSKEYADLLKDAISHITVPTANPHETIKRDISEIRKKNSEKIQNKLSKVQSLTIKSNETEVDIMSMPIGEIGRSSQSDKKSCNQASTPPESRGTYYCEMCNSKRLERDMADYRWSTRRGTCFFCRDKIRKNKPKFEEKKKNKVKETKSPEEIEFEKVQGLKKISFGFNKYANYEVKDRYNRVWVYCKKCEQIKASEEMKEYKNALGVCKKCVNIKTIKGINTSRTIDDAQLKLKL